jgi:hypothetical protein
MTRHENFAHQCFRSGYGFFREVYTKSGCQLLPWNTSSHNHGCWSSVQMTESACAAVSCSEPNTHPFCNRSCTPKNELEGLEYPAPFTLRAAGLTITGVLNESEMRSRLHTTSSVLYPPLPRLTHYCITNSNSTTHHTEAPDKHRTTSQKVK